MPRQAENGIASKPFTAAGMENRYQEMDEAISSLESSDEISEVNRLRARQGKLADAYFFKFIRPQLQRFQQAATA